MTKKTDRKDRRRRPDEYFSHGPIEIARFGKIVVTRNNLSSEQFAELQSSLRNRLPGVIDEIDDAIARASALVAKLPPTALLQRAWWQAAMLNMKVRTEAEIGLEHVNAFRMIDYVQSLVTSVPRAATPEDEVSEENWGQLSDLVETIFAKLNGEYQASLTAHNKTQDPPPKDELEEFRFKAETYWANIRGKRYQNHEVVAAEEVLSPHTQVIEELFDLTSAEVVEGLKQILHNLTFGLDTTARLMKELQERTLSALESEISSERPPATMEDALKTVFEEPSLKALADTAMGNFVGLDLFDVKKTTGWPDTLLEALSWSVGEDAEFFADGPHKGWPLRVWPIFKRPFLKIDGKYYCFDLQSLFDNFYRVMQRAIFRMKPTYKPEWSRKQKEISEQLPQTYFERLLPGCQSYSNIFYPWSETDRSKQWHEADKVFVYDDHLFIVEVKAGAFTYTSPATDLQATIASLENLVLNPSKQGARFLEYLRSARTVPLLNDRHEQFAELSLDQFRHVTVCAVTLDAFTEIAAQSQHLEKIGLGTAAGTVWSVSIDDLRVFADMFSNPLVFLHFIEQRMRAQVSPLLQLNDELDHLGLYNEQNNYEQYAREIAGTDLKHLDFTGYRSVIDLRFAQAIHDDARPLALQQDMPTRLQELVDFLQHRNKPHRVMISSFLLDVSGEFRSEFFSYIDGDLERQRTIKRPRFFSSFGDVRLTIYARLTPDVGAADHLALEHTQAVMVQHGEQDRVLIELVYDRAGKLIDVSWRKVTLVGLSAEALSRLRTKVDQLRRERVAHARSRGKIGPNEMCPCGSGKKYKRCCR